MFWNFSYSARSILLNLRSLEAQRISMIRDDLIETFKLWKVIDYTCYKVDFCNSFKLTICLNVDIDADRSVVHLSLTTSRILSVMRWSGVIPLITLYSVSMFWKLQTVACRNTPSMLKNLPGHPSGTFRYLYVEFVTFKNKNCFSKCLKIHAWIGLL